MKHALYIIFVLVLCPIRVLANKEDPSTLSINHSAFIKDKEIKEWIALESNKTFAQEL